MSPPFATAAPSLTTAKGRPSSADRSSANTSASGSSEASRAMIREVLSIENEPSAGVHSRSAGIVSGRRTGGSACMSPQPSG